MVLHHVHLHDEQCYEYMPPSDTRRAGPGSVGSESGSPAARDGRLRGSASAPGPPAAGRPGPRAAGGLAFGIMLPSGPAAGPGPWHEWP